MTMDIVILSLLFVLLIGGVYFLSIHVKETREKMFKEMEALEEELQQADDLLRIEKRFQPVVKAEPKPAESAPEEPAEIKPKKKKSSGRRGRPAKPKGDA